MIKHDLVGRDLTVVAAKNTNLVGIAGEVVDETTHTLRVRTDRGEKTLIKEQVTIKIDGCRIDGSLLDASPEKRVKRKLTRGQRKKAKK